MAGLEPVPPIENFTKVPAALAELIGRCLDKRPRQRPSASQVTETLSRMVTQAHIPATEESPFRGLLTFAERHAPFFYGRSAEIDALVEQVRNAPVVGVLGPSGAGKSSLVRAGVIPRLHEQALWRVLRIRPGPHPVRALAAQLLRAEDEAGPPPVDATTRQHRGPLGRMVPEPVLVVGDTELSERVGDALGPAEASPRSDRLFQADVSGAFPTAVSVQAERLARDLLAMPQQLALRLRALAERGRFSVLLFVDQLEELLTMGSSEPQQRGFLQAVCGAADDPLDPVRVIFTVRDDFFPRVARYPEVRAMLQQLIVVRSPERAALAEVLSRPLQLMDYSFDDPSLVQDMIDAVEGEPACLPLLQFTARKLWDQRDQEARVLRRADYERMGGVVGALAKHADDVLGGLTPTELEVARALLLQLVTAERTRRVVSREQVLEGRGAEAEDVLQQLTASRLITVRRTKGNGQAGAQLELAHEALIDAWTQLARWLDEGREDLRFIAETLQSAEMWEQRGRRAEELWQGDALAEAMRARQRCRADLPALVSQFLEAACEQQAGVARRKRLIYIAAISALAIVAVVLAVQKREADHQRLEAELQRTRAETRRGEALRQGARAAFGQRHLLEARAKLRMALEIEDTRSSRALWWQLANDPLLWSRQLDAFVYDLVFSPDGKQIAVASQDHTIHLFDAATRAERVLRGSGDQIFAVSYSDDGKLLASGGWDKTVRIWDLASGNLLHELAGHTGSVWSVGFSPDGRQLLSSSRDHTVRLWDVESGTERLVLKGHEAVVRGATFSPDGRLVASCSNDLTVRIWDAQTGKQLRVLRGHTRGIFHVVFSPDGAVLASGSGDRSIRIWDPNKGVQTGLLTGHVVGVRRVRFSPDGKQLASSSFDKTVRVWDLKAGKQTRLLPGHRKVVTGLDFSPTGDVIATASEDGSVRMWTLSVKPQRQRASGHRGAVNIVQFAPDSRSLATSGADGRVRTWDVATGEPKAVLRGHTGPVYGLSFSADGKLLASASADHSIRIWDPAGVTQLRVLLGHSAAAEWVDFHPDGATLASSGADRTARLWSVRNGGEQRSWKAHEAGLRQLRFSPDGAWLATGGLDKTLRLWDFATGRQLGIKRAGSAVRGIAFGPERTQLAWTSTDGSVRRWNIDSDIQEVVGTADTRFYGLAFHPDGALLGVASADGVGRLWPLDKDKPRRLLRGHRSEVNDIDFSADGRLAATTSDDGTVRVWNVATASPYWHAPVLLRSPPTLLTHLGWIRLDREKKGAEQAPPVLAKQMAMALRGQIRLADEAPDGKHLCLLGYDDAVQLWDTQADAKRATQIVPNVAQVLATGSGCALRTDKQVLLLRPGKEAVVLPVKGAPSAMALGIAADAVEGDSTGSASSVWGLVVAAGEAVFLFDEKGAPLGSHSVGVGVSALAMISAPTRSSGAEPEGTTPRSGSVTPHAQSTARWLALGFHDGNIELRPMRDGKVPRAAAFEAVPSSAPVRIVAGPSGTLVVGYANGFLGLWNTSSGTRLASASLHGPVEHVVLAKDKLYAASTLGQYLVWDMSTFRRDYCSLLREVWQQVPVAWRGGRPMLQTPPATHRCAKK